MDMISIRRKLMAKMQSGGGRLPPEYQEVAWIGSNGQAYLVLQNMTRYEPNVSIKTSVYWENVTSRQLHGADNRRYFGVVSGYYQNNQTGSTHTNIVAKLNQWQSIDYSRDNTSSTLIVDGEESTVEGSVSASVTVPFALFRMGTSSFPCFCRLKETQVVIMNTDYDLVPCYRKSDRTPGMYDFVSDVFHTNAGSGEFTVGPTVN